MSMVNCMHTKKAALHSLGCKVNAYETEAMQQLLEKAGYEIVPFEPGADVYVINTCTVTNIADRKSRQMLHRAKKLNPEAAVVAAGCYVQSAGEALSKDDAVDVSRETLKAICEAVSIPVIAIGGISAENVHELSGSGICGIAVISAIFGQKDIKPATEKLKKKTEEMVGK